MAGTSISSAGVTFPDSTVQATAAIASSRAYKVAKLTVNHDDSTPVTIVTLPASSVVIECLANVTTTFDGTTPTVSVGDASDTDGFMIASQVGVGVGGWKATGFGITRDYLYNSTHKWLGHLCTSQTAVIATIGVSGASQGVVDIYIIYIDLSVV